MGEIIKGKLTWEGLRSLIAGLTFAGLASACYLVPVLSEHGVELQTSAATVAQFGLASAAAAFGVGKVAEAIKGRG